MLILNGVSEFANWSSATQKLAEQQIIFTDDLSFELEKRINESDNVYEIIQEYYFKNDFDKMSKLISRCVKNSLLKAYDSFLNEVLNSYENEDYQITC